MPKLIIMNAATEQMLGGELTRAQRMVAIKAGWRHLWFAEEGDVIVMPSPASAKSLRYIGEFNGFAPSSLQIITLDERDGLHEALSDELLLSRSVVEKVRAYIRKSAPWTVMACYYSAGVAELANLLGIAPPPGSELAAQRGVDLFNRKTHFRQLAAGAGLPVAEGSVAYDVATLERAIRRHLEKTGTVIVKQDNNVLGMGNIALTREIPRALAGVRDVLAIRGDNCAELAGSLWRAMSSPWARQLVVESYHPESHALFVEYAIESNGVPRFLDSGLLRLIPSPDPASKELVWIGLDIPARLPPFAGATVIAESSRFASLAASLGYRGCLNIDAIVTREGVVLFNEINARWGGCSILHTVATRVLGTGYADRFCVSSRRNIASLPLDQMRELLQSRSIDLTPGSSEGVLVIAGDDSFSGSMECMIVGGSWDRVREMEGIVLADVARTRLALGHL